MFYRRKIILALLELLGGTIDKISFQKLLFLYSQTKKDSEYDFVPYKYGCYSFSLNADFIAMNNNGQLFVDDNFIKKNTDTIFFQTLKPNDKNLIKQVYQLYGKMNSESLIKHTYINFPYYATKSTIAEKKLTHEQYQKIKDYNKFQESNINTIYTIGYEGISLEHYLNKLIKNNVKILVDVRKNPLSMKFGFSKSQLIKYCQSLDIDYIHFPEVGVNSDQRQTLNSQNDYDKLFETYKKTTLKETEIYQKKIIDLAKLNNSIAITCFEANICQCHRKHLAESMLKLSENKITIKHI